MDTLERLLLANTADILGIDLEYSEKRRKLGGKGQRGVQLFDGYFLNVVPKIVEGTLYPATKLYENTVIAVHTNLTGNLESVLLVEGAAGPEFCATLHLIDKSKLKSYELLRDHWSRKSLYTKIADSLIEVYRLDTKKCDNWQKVDRFAVAEYLELRKAKGSGISSPSALKKVGLA